MVAGPEVPGNSTSPRRTYELLMDSLNAKINASRKKTRRVVKRGRGSGYAVCILGKSVKELTYPEKAENNPKKSINNTAKLRTAASRTNALEMNSPEKSAIVNQDAVYGNKRGVEAPKGDSKNFVSRGQDAV